MLLTLDINSAGWIGAVVSLYRPLSPTQSHPSLSHAVTQYQGNPMTEVLRSKLYYARSSIMIAIPTFCTIDSIPKRGQGIVRQLLASSSKHLSSLFIFASADALMAMTMVVIFAVLSSLSTLTSLVVCSDPHPDPLIFPRCSKKQTRDIATFFSVTYDEIPTLSLSVRPSSALNISSPSVDTALFGQLIESTPGSRGRFRSIFTRNIAISPAPSQARLNADDIIVDADVPLSADLEEVRQLLRPIYDNPSKLDPAKVKKLTALLKEMQQDL